METTRRCPPVRKTRDRRQPAESRGSGRPPSLKQLPWPAFRRRGPPGTAGELAWLGKGCAEEVAAEGPDAEHPAAVGAADEQLSHPEQVVDGAVSQSFVGGRPRGASPLHFSCPRIRLRQWVPRGQGRADTRLLCPREGGSASWSPSCASASTKVRRALGSRRPDSQTQEVDDSEEHGQLHHRMRLEKCCEDLHLLHLCPGTVSRRSMHGSGNVPATAREGRRGRLRVPERGVDREPGVSRPYGSHELFVALVHTQCTWAYRLDAVPQWNRA
jgi:hypothetical protein